MKQLKKQIGIVIALAALSGAGYTVLPDTEN